MSLNLFTGREVEAEIAGRELVVQNLAENQGLDLGRGRGADVQGPVQRDRVQGNGCDKSGISSEFDIEEICQVTNEYCWNQTSVNSLAQF